MTTKKVLNQTIALLRADRNKIQQDKDILLKALKAIRARTCGEWDNPDLVAYGPLTTISNDCLNLSDAAIEQIEREGI